MKSRRQNDSRVDFWEILNNNTPQTRNTPQMLHTRRPYIIISEIYIYEKS